VATRKTAQQATPSIVLLREIRFNVGGDPKDDAPYVQPDRKVDAAGNQLPEKPEPVPMQLGHELADGTFVVGAPVNRGLANIPADNTGGADVYYQHGSKTFRVILPPPGKQFQNEAGEAPQLPPEYNGDADRVALHYSWAPPARVDVQLVGRSWRDSNGLFYPLGETLMYPVSHTLQGKTDVLDQNYNYLKSHGVDYVRTAGQLDWASQTVDPFRPEYPNALAQTLERAYSHGLLTHLFAIGGKCSDPVGAARIMMSVIMDGRRHMVILGEATNEDKALSSSDAIAVARVLAPLGAFGIGMGNTDIENNIIPAGNDAGATLDFLHTERTPPEARMVRQCWDFHYFGRGSADNEGPGTGSSVGQMNDPVSHANKRAGSIICGAALYVHHCGSGVTGNDESNPNGQRYAHIWESPQHAEQLAALVNAVKRLPADVCSWPSRFNNNQPIDIPKGNVDKLYGATDGNRFVEIAIGADGPLQFRGQWRRSAVRFLDVATDSVLWEGTLAEGQLAPSINANQHCVVVGERA
jgi:hypothetical protein